MRQTVAEPPALGPLWGGGKNTDPAAVVQVHSDKAAWWVCPQGHSFQRSPRVLFRDPVCPQCKVGASSVSIADKRPTLAGLWHPEKNADLKPSTVDAMSTAPCWWRCSVG